MNKIRNILMYFVLMAIAYANQDTYYAQNSLASTDGYTTLSLNPSLLAESESNEISFVKNGSYDEKSLSVAENYGLFLKVGKIGFDFNKVEDEVKYGLSMGTKISNGTYAGMRFRWYNIEKGGEVDTSFTLRPLRQFSISTSVENVFSRNGQTAIYSIGTALRPIGDRITLSADVKVTDEKVEKPYYSIGIDSEIIDGLNLSFRYSGKVENYRSVENKLGAGFALSFDSIATGGYVLTENDNSQNGNYTTFVTISDEKKNNLAKTKGSIIVKLGLKGKYSEESEGGLGELIGWSRSKRVYDLINVINRMALDNEVSGILIETEDYTMSFSEREELRYALENFKRKGKKITAYFVSSSQNNYFLLSVADKIYMYPVGVLSLEGIGIETIFFRELLSKVGVDFQIARRGKYKSAGEMYSNTQYSDENREQLSKIQNNINEFFREKISEGREMGLQNLDEIMKIQPIHIGEDALKYRLVDKLIYKDELEKVVKEYINAEGIIMDESSYSKTEKHYSWDFASKKKIAIIYCTGAMIIGKSRDGIMGSDTIVELIRKAKCEPNVNAIVLRVDSGGGDAVAADIILRELIKVQNINRIPVVVSMGSLAASGGYYISSNADRIYADRSTITGSIGVIGMKPALNRLLFNVGITVDKIQTSKFSNYETMAERFTEEEMTLFQKTIDNFYERFITVVSEGRRLKKEDVDKVAQGRVWSAVDAKKYGLIDEIGGLNSAIDGAKELSGLNKLPETDVGYVVYTKNSQFDVDKLYGSVVSSIVPQVVKETVTEINNSMEIFGGNRVLYYLPETYEVK